MVNTRSQGDHEAGDSPTPRELAEQPQQQRREQEGMPQQSHAAGGSAPQSSDALTAILESIASLRAETREQLRAQRIAVEQLRDRGDRRLQDELDGLRREIMQRPVQRPLFQAERPAGPLPIAEPRPHGKDPMPYDAGEDADTPPYHSPVAQRADPTPNRSHIEARGEFLPPRLLAEPNGRPSGDVRIWGDDILQSRREPDEAEALGRPGPSRPLPSQQIPPPPPPPVPVRQTASFFQEGSEIRRNGSRRGHQDGSHYYEPLDHARKDRDKGLPSSFAGLDPAKTNPFEAVKQEALAFMRSMKQYVKRVRSECGPVDDAFLIGRIGTTFTLTAATWFSNLDGDVLQSLPRFGRAFSQAMFAPDAFHKQRQCMSKIYMRTYGYELTRYLLAFEQEFELLRLLAPGRDLYPMAKDILIERITIECQAELRRQYGTEWRYQDYYEILKVLKSYQTEHDQLQAGRRSTKVARLHMMNDLPSNMGDEAQTFWNESLNMIEVDCDWTDDDDEQYEDAHVNAMVSGGGTTLSCRNCKHSWAVTQPVGKHKCPQCARTFELRFPPRGAVNKTNHAGGKTTYRKWQDEQKAVIKNMIDEKVEERLNALGIDKNSQESEEEDDE